jgi:hypothetical protein
LLYEALELLGREHLGTGRVLDTLGMVYASKDNFHAACEFYRHALASKERFDDDAGLALTHGRLGRLSLDWGNLDTTAQHFAEDLRIAQRIRDTFGVALMHNHLGQVACHGTASAVLPSPAEPTASLCAGVTTCSSGILQEFLCQVTAVQVEIPTFEGAARGLNPIYPDLWRILHHFPRALDVAGLRR